VDAGQDNAGTTPSVVASRTQIPYLHGNAGEINMVSTQIGYRTSSDTQFK